MDNPELVPQLVRLRKAIRALHRAAEDGTLEDTAITALDALITDELAEEPNMFALLEQVDQLQRAAHPGSTAVSADIARLCATIEAEITALIPAGA